LTILSIHAAAPSVCKEAQLFYKVFCDEKISFHTIQRKISKTLSQKQDKIHKKVFELKKTTKREHDQTTPLQEVRITQIVCTVPSTHYVSIEVSHFPFLRATGWRKCWRLKICVPLV